MTNAPGAAFLHYGHQSVDEDDIAAVAAALRGDFLTTGPLVRRFEEAVAARLGAQHVVACSSGTAALHLAAMALGLGPGDVAVVPSLTFLATANAVRFTGAEVAFADVDSETGMLTPATLRAALEGVAPAHAKAVLPVHLAGMVADLPAIAAVAGEFGAAVIEDACHALGATYQARGGMVAVGSCAQSAMACFSTHPVKAITTGEGGLVATQSAELAERARRLRSHGIEHDPARWTSAAGLEDGKPAPWYYEMPEIGYNYRLTDIACALGLSQLGKLDRFLARRAALAARYDRQLAPLAPHLRPPARPQGGSAWHLYAVRIDFAALKLARGEVMRRLRAQGIGTQVHYAPVHTQPYYRARYGARDLPGAETYYRRTLSLPLYPAMAEEDVDRVVAALAAALKLR
ncbi:MAG TPA: UDP-4-amino-4,6-dideoxy-N-acetyl-beta-L-altrosamine transaminase [Stellaceae bacterium]|nr:UDP-4-amino-4,6-dideoxy-N-acetyl-beta-L-altrosamine transaminase [Stellaceae bacterium]